MALFSQIPANVLKRAKVGDHDGIDPKKIRFNLQTEARNYPISITSSDEETDVEEISDEPPTSSDTAVDPKEPNQSVKEHSDAIIQVDIRVKTVEQETQTEESMLNRPLSDHEKNRLDKQAYFTMYSMPKPRRTNGQDPPLKIGLTLRGRKRKVFYPHNDSDSD